MLPDGFECFGLLFRQGRFGTKIACDRLVFQGKEPHTSRQDKTYKQEQGWEQNRFFTHMRSSFDKMSSLNNPKRKPIPPMTISLTNEAAFGISADQKYLSPND